MTDIEKIEILRAALEIAGKYARENLPAELNFDYVWCYVDGQSDPNGIKFLDKWITDAIKKVQGEQSP